MSRGKLSRQKINRSFRFADERRKYAIYVAYARHSVNKRPSGERAWAVNGLAVVLGTPWGAVYVDVIRIQSQSSGLDGVVYRAIEHSHAWEHGRYVREHKSTFPLSRVCCDFTSPDYRMWNVNIDFKNSRNEGVQEKLQSTYFDNSFKCSSRFSIFINFI